MQKEEAFQEMLTGKKIKHKSYQSHEYIFLDDDGIITSEDGLKHSHKFGHYWQFLQDWQEDWDIYTEPKIKLDERSIDMFIMTLFGIKGFELTQCSIDSKKARIEIYARAQDWLRKIHKIHISLDCVDPTLGLYTCCLVTEKAPETYLELVGNY